jgi:hypothetical protein
MNHTDTAGIADERCILKLSARDSGLSNAVVKRYAKDRRLEYHMHSVNVRLRDSRQMNATCPRQGDYAGG